MDAGKVVTAKITCSRKVDQGDGQVALSFQPDYDNDRNKEWAKYTPSLSVSMNVLSEVAEQFEPGEAYTLSFSKNDD
jgi:hypothetical protein